MNIIKYPEINWSIPVLFSHDEYILSVASVMKRLNLPNPITYAYGMVPSLWTGGRHSVKQTQDKEKIVKLLEMIIETGTVPTFTMSRYDIMPNDIEDEFCNWLLDFGVQNNCNFIITSDLLYNHIKERHPEAKVVASVLKPIFELEFQDLSETDYYNMLLDKYDRVVVRPEYAKSTLLSEHDKITDISRIEVLINQICVPNCKFAQQEHLNIPKDDWAKFKNVPNHDSIFCPRDELMEKNFKAYVNSPSLIMTEDEIQNILNLGVKNLKLQGRNYKPLHMPRMINNYIFEEIGEFQNVVPIILGMCESIVNNGALPF